ncbi:unnamed protein product [Angiostrongylus costaricensis]|uniref:LIM zinc-binding domain-containing protein n=1 Tax=Angiostrongylus costaricensis TaxID=334426 RepID=A0A158PEF3_ANGCS|nr:unnamed protein product [Angiostrongylus costaricensis]
MEVHQSCFVDPTAFATDFSVSRADFVVMRPECVVAVPETLVPRSDFAASTADVRQFVLGQDCASRMNSDEDFVYAAPLKYKAEICSGCDRAIHERTLLTVNGRQFGTKCASCARLIHATDWVRRARQLSTGEEFALQDNRLLCKQHFVELVDGDSGSNQQKQKIKRVRTTFAEEQLSVLQAHFQVDSNPDGADLERIASITGLSKRVTQNSRARQKKYQGSRKGGDGTLDSTRSSEGPGSPSQKNYEVEENELPYAVKCAMDLSDNPGNEP